MKGNVVKVVLIAMFCAVTFLSAVDSGVLAAPPEAGLRIGGAGLSSMMVDRWAKEYEKNHPNWHAVVTGGSTGRGFAMFSAGDLDVVIASRRILDEERKSLESKGIVLNSKPIGKAGIAVITTSRNTVESLTLDQLSDIYRGRITNWKEVGGTDTEIRVLSRRVPESGAAVLFQEIVLKGKPFTTRAIIPETWSTVITVCQRAKDLPIGLAPASRSLAGTRVIGVKKDESSPAIAPTDENVQKGLYPITAQTYLYWDQKNSDARIAPFVDYCASMGGEK